MLTVEEAAAEMAAEESAGLRNNDGTKVISRLPSFRASAFKRVNTRQPSFFQKMFSMRQLDQELNGDDEEDGEGADKIGEGKEGEENKDQADGEGVVVKAEEKQQDESKQAHLDQDPNSTASNNANTASKNNTNNEFEEDEDEDEMEGDGGSKSFKKKNYAIDAQGQRIFYPPVMKVGQPLHVERLVNRNKHAGIGMEALMDMVDRDVREAIHHAKTVPVHPEIDRVQVTAEVSQYMAKVQSRRGVEKRFTNNMSEIQKALTYRKSSIIMMNSNYSNKLVRKIEPIYVQEARSIIKPT